MCRKSFLAFILAFLLRGCLGLEAPISGGGADDDSWRPAFPSGRGRPFHGDAFRTPAGTIRRSRPPLNSRRRPWRWRPCGPNIDPPPRSYPTDGQGTADSRWGTRYWSGRDPMPERGRPHMKLVRATWRRAGICEVAGRDLLYDETLFAGVAVLDAGRPLTPPTIPASACCSVSISPTGRLWPGTPLGGKPSSAERCLWRANARNPGPRDEGAFRCRSATPAC